MMAYIRYTLLIAAALGLGTAAWAQSVTAGPLELISDQFRFTEGPAADEEGNVFFTDQPNNTNWKYDVHGTLPLFIVNAGRSNGLFVGGPGRLSAIDAEHITRWAINPA